MSRRVRDVLIGVALTAIAFLGVLYQVNEAQGEPAPGESSLPRLMCPLH
jgi:hypothetical protein